MTMIELKCAKCVSLLQEKTLLRAGKPFKHSHLSSEGENLD